MKKSIVGYGTGLALIASLASSLGCSKSEPKAAESTAQTAKAVSLLNVSYDPTRELYEDYNKAFAKHWLDETKQEVSIQQSHGGSGKQARSVIDGLEADVVTLALAYDIDALVENGGLIRPEWQAKLADNSAPYVSTIVFVVRKGNPKAIKDWSDIVRKGVSVITPNPKTSGGARWAYLAAWGYAQKLPGGSEQSAKDFVKRFYQNVAVLDSGARGSTTTFVQNKIGDVLLTWENEAHLVLAEAPAGDYEIVVPSISILAEPPVAIVDKNVDKHGTRQVAEAYLKYLYSDEGQEIVAKHFYRPRNQSVLARHKNTFPELTLFSLHDLASDWKSAHQKHFADGGTFDQLYTNQ